MPDRQADVPGHYRNPDNDLRGPWRAQDLMVPGSSPNFVFSIAAPGGQEVAPPPGRRWRCSAEQYQEWLDDNRIWFDAHGTPRLKVFLSEVQERAKGDRRMQTRSAPGRFQDRFVQEYIGCGQCGNFWGYVGTGEGEAEEMPRCPECGCNWRAQDGLRHCKEVMIAVWLAGQADTRDDLKGPPCRLGQRVLDILRGLRLDIREVGQEHGFPPVVEGW